MTNELDIFTLNSAIALVRAEPDRDAGPTEPPYVGRVIKLLSRARHRVLGVLRVEPNGHGRIVPIDKKQAGRELDGKVHNEFPK